MTDFKIPKRLIVGYKKRGGNIFAYPTEIRISNRTKKSAFKIEKNRSWLNKIDDKLPKKQVKNELRDGFQILYQSIQVYSNSAARSTWYLWHEDFEGHLFIQPNNLFDLIQTCTIEKNRIKEKLIYDGSNFITEEKMNYELKEASSQKDVLKTLRDEMKSRKVLSKDLVPGMVYEPPPSKKNPVSTNYLVYLGKITEENGQEWFVTRTVDKSRPGLIGEGKMTNRTHSTNATIGNQEYGKRVDIKIPGEILGITTGEHSARYFRNRNTPIEIKYNGVALMMQSHGAVKFTKTLPGQFLIEDGVKINGLEGNTINIYCGYGKEELDVIEQFLLRNQTYHYDHIVGVSTDAVTKVRADLDKE